MEVTFITEGCTVNQHQSDKTTSLDIVCIEPQELKFGQLSHPYVQNFPEEDPQTHARVLPYHCKNPSSGPGQEYACARSPRCRCQAYDSLWQYECLWQYSSGSRGGGGAGTRAPRAGQKKKKKKKKKGKKGKNECFWTRALISECSASPEAAAGHPRDNRVRGAC